MDVYEDCDDKQEVNIKFTATLQMEMMMTMIFYDYEE
jgi:hypothetical protein